MSARVVVLLVDALGWEQVQRCSRLLAALPHRRRVETVLGFSSGALPTLFTGRSSSEHGRWLMYRRAGRVRPPAGTRPRSPFAGFGLLRLLPPRLRRSWRLGRLLARLVRARGVRGYFNLYQVPRPLLAQFDLAERDDIFKPGGLPCDSLWDTLDRRGVRWRGWDWRTPEEVALNNALACLASGDERFLFVYTAGLDDLLHHEGSSGDGVRDRLDRYATWIAEAAGVAARRGETLWLYLLSDHGMVDVHASLDVMGALARLPLRWPRDYLAFFDSTMARFWWRTPGAREAVRACLDGLRAGRWLDDQTLEREGARFPAREYDEDIFLLDPGVLMVPSFMGSAPVAAMHGYDPAHPDMAAALLSNRPVPESVRRLGDLRAFLEGELEAAGVMAHGPEAA